MAQMAPALTEANASPGSSRKNSVDRCYSSTVPEEVTQGSLSSGVDLKLLSRNGLVRLLEDTDSNNITNTNGAQPSRLSSTPKNTKRNEQQLTTADMPNGHCDGNLSRVVESMTKSANAANDSQNQKPAIPSDLSERTCASSTSTTTVVSPTGACNIESENEQNIRIAQQPVATFDSRKMIISKRTLRSLEQQARLEQRVKKLEKRLRRLQARQIGAHVHRQLNGIVNQHKEKSESSNSLAKQGGNTTSEVVSEGMDVSARGPLVASTPHSLETDKASVIAKKGRNASSSNIPSENRYENAIKYSPESVNKTIRIALIEEKQRYEAESLAESLRAHAEHLEAMDDSDATEASSEDESEEEEYLSSSLHSKTSKMLRRQYHREQGEIASQWSWLQSQIINLERQIRRYEDLHKSVVLSKQPIKLQATIPAQATPLSEVKNSTPAPYRIPSSPPAKLNNISSLSEQPESKLKSMFKEPENHLRNGMKKTLLQDTVNVDEDEIPLKKLRSKLLKNDMNDQNYSMFMHSSDTVTQCARTRGIYPIAHRPLVHLPWIQLKCKSKKSSCQCCVPETPCLSCSTMAKMIPVVESSQLKAERVALLDQSFHPVLSFPTEIPLQFHFASLLKKGGFESRTQPVKPQPVKTSSHVDKKKQKSNRRAQLAKGAAASLLSSAKLRNQRYERKRGYTSLPSTPKNSKTERERDSHTDVIPRKKRAAAISAAAQLQKRARSLSLPCTTSSSPSTPTSSPSPTPPLSNSLPPSTLSLMLRKKRANNAFDINNIVIPYSMASSTRVEKLQYKEILTPSWRVLEIKTEDMKDATKNCESEDLSDDIMAVRHDICEEHERKRFLGYLNKKRKRSSRQSSETSNPDGAGLEFGSTPPGTPLLHSPSPTSAGVTALTPSFHRSFSLDSRLAHQRSSSTESLQKTTDVESWPTVNPFPDRTFPLSEAEEAALKLPTPQPTPVPSRPTSPSPVSSPASPMYSPLASPASVDSNDTIEDKNEWTVKLVTTEQDGGGDQPRKGIVLKLAKR